ncbi:N-acetyl-gamma-glutamyl-phosphate reductase [Paludibacter jiangxiensis]|uniref:N-acetyl-gamma-glutamyl-phosphate reductase n=1 Tax=Paludibacter jiangxiensis TaxID=681398 RepID=A0A171ALI1_9BACT|nr:N-acetyl-gamma-glutamyl-phosphate reductase [Paludibacter jiangxiensis]GAT63931.1 N-acetyl-gamma-glutamyl-phosphate reductase [Paludibacter jiangxiensis]
MIKTGIIGGAGYTAGELLRLLINHPEVEITFVHSGSNAGNKITAVHSGLLGETDLVFTDSLELLSAIDLLFFCTAHGDTKKFIDSHELPANLRIIDLSTDYRAKRDDHDFVYGLPELNREAIIKAQHIANPGCFATAIQLAVLPLAQNGSLNEVHVNAITGSTGAGVKPGSTTHFSWRNDNISVYKAFEHQHLAEITQSIKQLQSSFDAPINFIPVRGDFARGIFATVYTECDLTIEEAKKLYSDYYLGHPFTIIADSNPDLKQVINTNKCVLYLEKHGNKLLIISVIDNLLKGASGQAVHNMNLIFGLPENTGLKLKPLAF